MNCWRMRKKKLFKIKLSFCSKSISIMLLTKIRTASTFWVIQATDKAVSPLGVFLYGFAPSSINSWIASVRPFLIALINCVELGPLVVESPFSRKRIKQSILCELIACRTSWITYLRVLAVCWKSIPFSKNICKIADAFEKTAA